MSADVRDRAEQMLIQILESKLAEAESKTHDLMTDGPVRVHRDNLTAVIRTVQLAIPLATEHIVSPTEVSHHCFVAARLKLALSGFRPDKLCQKALKDPDILLWLTQGTHFAACSYQTAKERFDAIMLRVALEWLYCKMLDDPAKTNSFTPTLLEASSGMRDRNLFALVYLASLSGRTWINVEGMESAEEFLQYMKDDPPTKEALTTLKQYLDLLVVVSPENGGKLRALLD